MPGIVVKSPPVMQSPWTLREAETKKGRCSVSDNGPLTFLRRLDVVVDVTIVARTLDAESSFRKCGEKSETSERNPIFSNKTAGHRSSKQESGPGISDFPRTFEIA